LIIKHLHLKLFSYERIKVLVTVCFCCILISCGEKKENVSLFEKFQNPAADARPMVRWWWNGNCVVQDEIKRELALLKNAGIGGVEINSIGMPSHAKETNVRPLKWAGKEWCNMVKTASMEAKELGMIADLIVGSGWPFGGRFLNDNETIQRLNIKREMVKANTTIDIDLKKYFSNQNSSETDASEDKRFTEVMAVKLIPLNISSPDEVVDISSELKDNHLTYKAGPKDYVLTFLYKERNFRSVSVGSPGADGPVMDHYNTAAVEGYLNRLKVLEKETGMSLSKLIRALFCDSIELSGSNWTDDMKEQFVSRNGYDVTPWLPFIIQHYNQENRYTTTAEMAVKIKRIQYDFYNTIIDVFLERFTTVFQKFCTENGVLCRYQAYGHPFYMGLFQGNMIPDIPESNNWIYSRGRDEAEIPQYTWVQNHGYMLWNKAASSGAHIMGRKITSNEAMTNTQGVFRTSLETIKQSDDINFITGMNHSVLHGFNYSPPEAGFPGWVRFGTYFSEQNTWWKFFRNWTDYNARLSSVFQNSRPDPEIAILGRLRDCWGEYGLTRSFVNEKPWYYARLWEPISNLGNSCDYIHQPVLETSEIVGQELICGEMSYKAVFLTDVESMTPAAAKKLHDFARAGGKVVFIGCTPDRSLSFRDAAENDRIVKESIESILAERNVLEVTAPEKEEDFIQWTNTIFRQIELDPQVKISNPVSYLYSLKHESGKKTIWFFANSHRKKAVEFDASFKTGSKIPYVWLPSSGERFAIESSENDKLHIRLDALESALIVFEEEKIDLPIYEFKPPVTNANGFKTSWDVKFEHVNGEVFNRNLDQLINFGTSDDEAIRTFSGTVTYSAMFENGGNIRYVKLQNVNEGVSELFINGKPAGMKWYGNHCYDITPFVREGMNKLEIKLTTTLANYCMSLDDNPAAEAWTRSYKQPFSSGLEGVVLAE